MSKKELDEKLIENGQELSDGEHVKEIRKSLRDHTLNEDVSRRYWFYFFIFAFLGLVNNTGYVMIGTASHDLAESFDKKNLMPMFGMCEILFSGFVKFINSKYLIKIKHYYRLGANSILMICAYVLIASITIKTFEAAFWIALFWALMHGCTCALGESTILGLLKGFPSRLVGAFGSGTGFAGVFGSGIFLVLKPFMSDGVIFIIVIPLVFVYFTNVLIAVRMKSKYSFVEENPQAESRAASVRKSLNEDDEENEQTEVKEKLEGIDIGDDAAQNIQMNLPNFLLIVRKIGWYIFNIAFVYFLEYAWTTSFADIYSRKIKTKAEDEGKDTNSFFIANTYVIFAFWYQIGVFISRSSLEFIKINKIWILTFLQFVNFVFWFITLF